MTNPFLTLFLIYIVAVVYSLYVHYGNSKKKKSLWQEFSKRSQFSFTSSPPTITGIYQGYTLKIETFRKNLRTFTRFVLSNTSLNENTSTTIEINKVRKYIKKIVSNRNPSFAIAGKIIFSLTTRSIWFEYSGFDGKVARFQNIIEKLHQAFDAYLAIGIMGSKVVPILEQIAKDEEFYQAVGSSPAEEVIDLLIESICNDTTGRLAEDSQRLFCTDCLARCYAHKVTLHWLNTHTYYGCRICCQSHSFYKGPAIAILNNNEPIAISEYEDRVEISWLARRALFDFDAVHIINATDEEVERFAVQVGNDTDEIRKPGYAKMRCVVAPECELSLNTMRILERTFGQVSLG